MKKLLFFLTLTALFSCEKEPECWTCKMQTVKTYISVLSDETVTVMKCDMTAEEIFEFEAENTESYTEQVQINTGGYITVNVKKTTTCKK